MEEKSSTYPQDFGKIAKGFPLEVVFFCQHSNTEIALFWCSSSLDLVQAAPCNTIEKTTYPLIFWGS